MPLAVASEFSFLFNVAITIFPESSRGPRRGAKHVEVLTRYASCCTPLERAGQSPLCRLSGLYGL